MDVTELTNDDPRKCVGCGGTRGYPKPGFHVLRHGACSNCGASPRYPVRRIGRQRPIGGKRGRNSGTVKTSKQK